MGWGDELMVTGQVRELQQNDPRKVRIEYEKGRWHEAWHHNPRIAHPKDAGDFQVLRPREGYLRPYIAAKQPRQWQWKAWGPPVGELYFTPDEAAFGLRHAGKLIIEPNLKVGASPNKEWGWIKWNKLALLLQARGHRVTQLGSTAHPTVEGAELICTPTMRHAAAVMRHAIGAVLPEGGLHHVAAAVGTPAVVIFGGYISPAVTGYASQVSLFADQGEYPLGCGMRVKCSHCASAMKRIVPEQVVDAIERILRVPASGHLAA